MARGPLAGASGPGKFSARTDSGVGTPEMKLGSIAYGEGQETQAIKSGAPLATSPDVTASQASAMSTNQTPVTPLYAATNRPDEPITQGANIGAGLGSDSLMMNQIKQDDQDIVAKYLPSLTAMAAQQDTPKSFRAFVSFLQGTL